MLAFEDLAFYSTSPDIIDSWYQLQHNDLVEILGLQWAMDTDFKTSYFDNYLLVYAYFRTDD